MRTKANSLLATVGHASSIAGGVSSIMYMSDWMKEHSRKSRRSNPLFGRRRTPEELYAQVEAMRDEIRRLSSSDVPNAPRRVRQLRKQSIKLEQKADKMVRERVLNEVNAVRNGYQINKYLVRVWREYDGKILGQLEVAAKHPDSAKRKARREAVEVGIASSADGRLGAEVLLATVLPQESNSYKATPRTPLHVHDYERTAASGNEHEVSDYWRGKRGKGPHPRVSPTPRPNPTDYEQNVASMERAIREKITELKREGTVGMGIVNLQIIVRPKLTPFAFNGNRYAYNQAFLEAARRVKVRGFSIDYSQQRNPAIRTIADVPHGFTLVTDSQDVEAVKEHLGRRAKKYDSFFVLVGDGDYEAVYGFYGSVAANTKPVYKIRVNGMFNAEATAKARRVQPRFTRTDTGQQGVVVARFGEKVKVLFDNGDRPSLIDADLITISEGNPSSDNPACPKCGHYNAMLVESYDGERGEYKLTCRDCGFTSHVPEDFTAGEIKRALRQAAIRTRSNPQYSGTATWPSGALGRELIDYGKAPARAQALLERLNAKRDKYEFGSKEYARITKQIARTIEASYPGAVGSKLGPPYSRLPNTGPASLSRKLSVRQAKLYGEVVESPGLSTAALARRYYTGGRTHQAYDTTLRDRLLQLEQYGLVTNKGVGQATEWYALEPKTGVFKRNGTERVPGAVLKNSRMFHGEHNAHVGRQEEHVVSNYVPQKYGSRCGSLPYIKMYNWSRGTRHSNPRHACADCSILFPNPRTSKLGMSAGRKLIIMGKGVHRVGQTLRRGIARENPGALTNEIVDLGPIAVVPYLTEEKHSPSQELILYYHTTAEETGRVEDMPHLYSDPEGMLFIPQSGEGSGAYDIDERGIIN